MTQRVRSRSFEYSLKYSYRKLESDVIDSVVSSLGQSMECTVHALFNYTLRIYAAMDLSGRMGQSTPETRNRHSANLQRVCASEEAERELLP